MVIENVQICHDCSHLAPFARDHEQLSASNDSDMVTSLTVTAYYYQLICDLDTFVQCLLMSAETCLVVTDMAFTCTG